MQKIQNLKEEKSSKGNSPWNVNYIILFLIWPFISLIYAIKNHRRPYAKNIVWLFTIFYGLTFVIVSDSLDASRIISQFQNVRLYGLSSFQILLKENEYFDLLQPFLLYVVSFFTTDSRILFGVIGLIFGYFYSRNLWLGIELLEEGLNKYAIILIFLFALIIPIWEINGFRMWTAAHVFFFGVSKQLLTGNRKYAIYSILTPLIHFSFIFAVVAYVSFLIIKRLPINLIFGIFLFSIIVQEIKVDIREYRTLVPEPYQIKIEGYSNIEFLMRMKEKHMEMRWWAKYQYIAIEYLLDFLTIMAFISYKKNLNILRNQGIKDFFTFTLWMASLSRFFSALPLGDNYRFVIITNLFIAFSLVMIYGNKLRTVKIPFQFLITVLIIGFYSIVELRKGFDRIAITTFISNPFTLWFFDDTKPLIIFIKQLLGF